MNRPLTQTERDKDGHTPAFGVATGSAIPPALSLFLGRQIIQTLTPGQSNTKVTGDGAQPRRSV